MTRSSVRTISLGVIGLILTSICSVEAGSPSRPDLSKVERWGYQLQSADFDQIAKSDLDLMVIDASRDGTATGAYTKEEISRLKIKPDGSRRLAISYFSIGEAEDYRGYWQPEWTQHAPDWLGKENPSWPGNYPVKFWHREWQEIILRQLDKIIEAGFDGIYLDRVDVYWEHRDHPGAADKMIAFVKRLADHARSVNPSFIVIAQNAEALLENDAYADLIDGEGKEDLIFGVDGDGVPNSEEELYWSKKYLRAGYSKGVPVFVIEYLADKQKRKQAAKEIRTLGFLPIFSRRALDVLSQTSP
ncbi:MAG: endo alpha-1,4 polygalactosaminidase [Rhodobacteraceae bacterium]|nr:endo alpha-1,4 polygalactosaminidase [Paracoccaceae bacterium]